MTDQEGGIFRFNSGETKQALESGGMTLVSSKAEEYTRADRIKTDPGTNNLL